MNNLDPVVHNFVAFLHVKYVEEIRTNPQQFRRRLLSRIKAELPIQAGRPPCPEVTRALEMWDSGYAWPKVYSECIPGFSSMTSAERTIASTRLRASVRERKSERRRRRTRPDDCDPI